MNRAFIYVTVFLIIFVVILGVLWLTGYKNPNDNATEDTTITSLRRTSGDTESGNVSVDVTFINNQNASDLEATSYDLDNNFVFFVEMNTHSVDITKYKMAELSFLKVAAKNLRASKWEASMEGGGHHRSGFLLFEKKASDNDAKELKLVIKKVAGVAEREFSWSF